LLQVLRISFHKILDINSTSYLNTYYIEKSGCTSREDKNIICGVVRVLLYPGDAMTFSVHRSRQWGPGFPVVLSIFPLGGRGMQRKNKKYEVFI
jgi:hypothetical protein